jgi:hypothetical protein
MNIRTIFMLLFVGIFLISFVNAQPPGQQSSIEKGLVVESAFSEIHKQGNPLYVHAHVFNSSNGVPLYSSVATYVGCHYHAYSHNLGGEHIITNGVMTSYGVGWNGSIAGNYFNETGRYSVLIWCNSTADGGFLEYSFDVTPSGSNFELTHSYIVLGILLLIILLSLASFYTASSSISSVAKLTFYTISIIFMLIAVLFMVVVAQQTLFGFDNILSGVETFWFIIKTSMTLGIVVFFVVIFLMMLKYWKIKRGLIDK